MNKTIKLLRIPVLLAGVALCLTALGRPAIAADPVWDKATELYAVKFFALDASMGKNDEKSYLLLTPSYTQQGDEYLYSYKLQNMAPKEYIDIFALTFYNGVNADSFTSFTHPSGWECWELDRTARAGKYYELLWKSNIDFGYKETVTFSFTSNLSPSETMNAVTGGMGVYGYSGITYGLKAATPVPEASSVMLAVSGLSSLGCLRFLPRRREINKR